MDRVIEICCGSYYDALMAYKGGAKRIELNSALYLGGLTPTLASLIMTKENTDLKVICMVRPRSAGFCYLDEDYEVMLRDAELLLKNGADGIAFGFLDENSEIEFIANLLYQIQQSKCFLRVHTCCRFVKKQKLRIQCQCSGNFQLSLKTVWKICCCHISIFP